MSFLPVIQGLPIAAAPAQVPLLGNPLFMMALVFGIFYLLVFAPMRKRQKKHQEMLSALKNGDRVITNGGIFATVVGVGEDRIQLRIADQVKIDVSRNAIAALQSPESQD